LQQINFAHDQYISDLERRQAEEQAEAVNELKNSFDSQVSTLQKQVDELSK
jgi:hypothetical protein